MLVLRGHDFVGTPCVQSSDRVVFAETFTFTATNCAISMDLHLTDAVIAIAGAIIDIHGGFGCFKDTGSDNFLWEEQPC